MFAPAEQIANAKSKYKQHILTRIVYDAEKKNKTSFCAAWPIKTYELPILAYRNRNNNNCPPVNILDGELFTRALFFSFSCSWHTRRRLNWKKKKKTTHI